MNSKLRIPLCWKARGAFIRAAAFAVFALTFLRTGAAFGLTVVGVTSDNGLPARSIRWIDATGQERIAIMVDQRQQGAGYLRQLTYPVDGVPRVCKGTGEDGHNGDGYVQNHTAEGGDNSSHFVPGTTTVVLAGPHHAIISYEMPNYKIGAATIPTTVQWFFADGRSHPLFILSQDARATAGNLGADSRSPYGDVAYDGGADAAVGGASYGDTYKFVTLAAAPEQVTRASGWRDNEPNTIPYAMQWTDPAQADAEMGHVATVPITVQDQGSDSRVNIDVRGTEKLNGPMIDDDAWAYQILNYVLPDAGPTGSKRLTWGSNWGLPGGFNNGDQNLNPRDYFQHSTDPLGQSYAGSRADGMLLAYSVFVVFGTHSGGYKDGTVGQVVKQMEGAARASLSAATGTVKTSGPAGVGNAGAVPVTYTPTGYNSIYSTWEIVASGNAVDATLAPPAGTALDHPVLVVNGYTLAQLPTTIAVGNGLNNADVDYFATLDAANQRLWITVNRLVTAPLNLKVVPGGGGPQTQPPVISSIPASGTPGSPVIITGVNFTGATKVTFNGTVATFTIDSPTQITAIVPIGATAGPIAVTTPDGTTASATNFTPLTPAGTGVIPGTFQQMDTDDGGWFTGFAVHSSGRLFGRTDVGGIYRSDDHGEHWIYLSGDMTSYTGHTVQGVAVASADSNVVYQCVGFVSGGSEQGVWKSVDGGVTWKQVKSGIHFSGNDPERFGGECIAIRPGNDKEVWAGSRGDGLWFSSDAGTNWVKVSDAIFANAQFTSISLPGAGRSDIWIGASGFDGPGGVWVSVNDGGSWTYLAGNHGGVGGPQGCWRITREPNGKVLIAGGNTTLGSVLYEVDASDWANPATYTWADISWPGIDRAQDAPLVAALADGTIVAGSIFGGYNGGPDSLRTQVRSTAGVWTPIDALNGPMPGWQRTPAPTLIEGGRNALLQDPTDPNRWFMAGGYGPFRTTDAGKSWQYIVNGIDEVVDYKVNFHPSDSNRVYLPMADHGGAVVLDGGASGTVSRYITTRTLPFPDDLGLCHAILANNDRLLALGADERNNWRPRIFKSTDNGQIWSVLVQAGLPDQDNRAITSAIASRDNPDDILLAIAGTDNGADGGVYRSTNGGGDFTKATGLPTAADYGDQWNVNADLEVDATDNGVRYLFLKNYGLYKSTNRGAAWTFLNTGLPNYGVMAADASVGGHIWVGTCCDQPVGLTRSVNGGNTWTTVTGFVNVTDVDAVADRVAVLGQRNGDTYDKIYYSGDAGATWGEITRQGYRFGDAIAVAVDPWRVGTVWISNNGRSVARFTPGLSNGLALTIKSETTSAGLKILSGQNEFDRQNIVTATTSNDYGWIGAANAPVTYALSIGEFPPPTYSGFQAHVFLVPNSTGSIAPDYAEPSVVMLDIQSHPDGTASGWLRYKINAPESNDFLYGAGTLGHLDCPTGPLGTWRMTFLQDTNITLTAPNGATLALSLPDAAATRTAFGGKLTAYFGNQPNDVSQVGQSTTFSRIQILGAPRAQPIDETFPGPELNQHPTNVSWEWLKLAESPSGISTPASNDGLVIGWPLPDTGYTLQFTPTLSPPAWQDLSLPNVLVQENSKAIHVSIPNLPSSTKGFFRLAKPQ